MVNALIINDVVVTSVGEITGTTVIISSLAEIAGSAYTATVNYYNNINKDKKIYCFVNNEFLPSYIELGISVEPSVTSSNQALKTYLEGAYSFTGITENIV
jgi:hypothetical protein